MTFLLPIPILEPGAPPLTFRLFSGSTALPTVGHIQVKVTSSEGALTTADKEYVYEETKMGVVDGVWFAPISYVEKREGGFEVEFPTTSYRPFLLSGNFLRIRFGSNPLPSKDTNFFEWVQKSKVQGFFGEWSNPRRISTWRGDANLKRIPGIDTFIQVTALKGAFDGRASLRESNDRETKLYGTGQIVPSTTPHFLRGGASIKGVYADGHEGFYQGSADIEAPEADKFLSEGLRVAFEDGFAVVSIDVPAYQDVHLYRFLYPSNEGWPLMRAYAGWQARTVVFRDCLAILGQNPLYYGILATKEKRGEINKIIVPFSRTSTPVVVSPVSAGWLYVADRNRVIKLAEPLISNLQKYRPISVTQTLGGQYASFTEGREKKSRILQVEGVVAFSENADQLPFVEGAPPRHGSFAPPGRPGVEDFKEEIYPEDHRRAPRGPKTEVEKRSVPLLLYQGASIERELAAEGAFVTMVLDWLNAPGYKVLRSVSQGTLIGVVSGVTISYPSKEARVAKVSFTFTETHSELRPPAELFIPRRGEGVE